MFRPFLYLNREQSRCADTFMVPNHFAKTIQIAQIFG